MELYDRAYQIQSLFDGRHLFQYLLAMFSVNGHIDRLRQLGKVGVIRGAWPVKWELA